MIHTESERMKAARRLVRLKLFEKRTTSLFENISLNYDEPLVAVRKEIEFLEREIKEFDELDNAETTPVASSALRDIPRFLLQARHRLGWSLTDFAKKLSISPQLMSKYEKNYLRLPLSTIVDIVEVVEIPISQRFRTRAEAEAARTKLTRTWCPTAADIGLSDMGPNDIGLNDIGLNEDIQAGEEEWCQADTTSGGKSMVSNS